MADYQLRARIPQGTADKLFEVMKDLHERTEGADVTISSVIRQAVDDYIEAKEDLRISVPANRLKAKEAEMLIQMFKGLQGEDNPLEVKRFLAILINYMARAQSIIHEKENPDLYKFMRENNF